MCVNTRVCGVCARAHTHVGSRHWRRPARLLQLREAGPRKVAAALLQAADPAPLPEQRLNSGTTGRTRDLMHKNGHPWGQPSPAGGQESVNKCPSFRTPAGTVLKWVLHHSPEGLTGAIRS